MRSDASKIVRPATTTRKKRPMPDEAREASRSNDAIGARIELGRSMKKSAQTPNITEPTNRSEMPRRGSPRRNRGRAAGWPRASRRAADTPPHQGVGAGNGDEVQNDDLGQVREVRVKPDEPKRAAVEQQREGRPVLVHGPQVVQRSAVERDRAPFVLPEGE